MGASLQSSSTSRSREDRHDARPLLTTGRGPLDAIERARPGRIRFALVLLLLFHVAVHARYLALPPLGFHLWRQTDTLVIARNFHEESMNPFLPRSSYRGDTPGIVGMELPWVPYLMALGYRLVGERFWVARVTSLGLSLLTLAGCYFFARRLFGSARAGLASAALLAFSPLFSFYSIAALPDVPMLAALYGGLMLLVGWVAAAPLRRTGEAAASLPPASEGPPPSVGRSWALVGAAGLLALAALTKLSAAVVAPVVAWCGWRAWNERPAARRSMALVGTAALALVAGWYLQARHLNEVYGLPIFKLDTSWPYPASAIARVVPKLTVRWLPELFIGYAALPFFIAGMFALARRPDTKPVKLDTASTATRPVVLGLGLGVLAYVVAFLPMLEIHDYYMIAALPLLVAVSTAGFERLARAAEGRPRAQWGLLSLIALAAVLGPYRGLSRLEGQQAGADLVPLGPALDRLIPRDALIVTAADRSPNIHLYFMHRTGWSVPGDVSDSSFADMAARGARYLVSDSRALERRPAVAPSLRPIGQVGRFNVFAIAAD